MRKARPEGTWIVLATFRPGEKGTKRLLRDWGDRLVCVRYRYNASRESRLKTAEIVVSEASWKRRGSREVVVEVRSWEKELRDAIVRAGGRWDSNRRMWVVEKEKIARLGLEGRARTLGAARPSPRVSTRTLPSLSKAYILGNRKAYNHGSYRPKASNPGNR